MLCKNCGKELPVAGKFCPFCGAPTEIVGVNDETAVFTPIPEENTTPKADDPFGSPIDTAAFDAAMQGDRRAAQPADPLADTGEAPQMPPIDVPPVRRAAPQSASTAPRTTYFEPDPSDRPYKKPSKGAKAGVIALVVVLVVALIGGGVWFAMSRRPDENITAAEKYMERAKFDDALEAYQTALADAKDPSSIQLQIDLLKSYQQGRDAVESGDYSSALALLTDLKNRITDTTSPLYDAVDELITQANQKQSESKFAADLQQAVDYIASDKLDAAAGQLDALASDGSLTSEQKKQIEDVRKTLTEKQDAAKRQEETAQEQAKQKDAFVTQIDQLEEFDKKLSSASSTAEQLELTSSSFDAWDTLLNSMYDHLQTSLNADAYASEESQYKDWVKERDTGAESAANDALKTFDDKNSDEAKTAANLARTSFKQSYTKSRCYRVLDKM